MKKLTKSQYTFTTGSNVYTVQQTPSKCWQITKNGDKLQTCSTRKQCLDQIRQMEAL